MLSILSANCNEIRIHKPYIEVVSKIIENKPKLIKSIGKQISQNIRKIKLGVDSNGVHLEMQKDVIYVRNHGIKSKCIEHYKFYEDKILVNIKLNEANNSYILDMEISDDKSTLIKYGVDIEQPNMLQKVSSFVSRNAMLQTARTLRAITRDKD